MIINHLKSRLSAAEEQTKPRDTLSYVVFDVQFSDGSRKRMDARDLFSYALLRDIDIARRGADPGAILDESKTMLPYVDYQVIRGKWSDLPSGIVRSQIKSIKGV